MLKLGRGDCFLLLALLHLRFLFVSIWDTNFQDVTTDIGGKMTLR